MQIRAAITSDASAIVEIWNEVIGKTALTFTSEPKTVEGISADITARGEAFLVAEGDDMILGFATYFPFRGGNGYRHTKEHTISLRSAAQGQGVGRALMVRLEDVARQQNVHSLFAGVSGENPDGIAFHAAIGYREIARLPEVGRKFGRWMDLILMQKIL